MTTHRQVTSYLIFTLILYQFIYLLLFINRFVHFIHWVALQFFILKEQWSDPLGLRLILVYSYFIFDEFNDLVTLCIGFFIADYE